MALKKEKNEAIKLRRAGKSYSQIKETLGVSKSTLSGWLSNMPLSKQRLNELQRNQQVIEKIRSAKLKTRNTRLTQVRNTVLEQITPLSKREFLIAGFFLYWAEGGKTKTYTATLSNTDPRMIRAFIKWLKLLEVSLDKMYIRLHLYADMNEVKEIDYWSKELKVAKDHFRKSYIKKSKLSDLTYISRGHGTCNIIMPGRDIAEFIIEGQAAIADLF
jgi:transcriptional regulator with XRE-family HTH domain